MIYIKKIIYFIITSSVTLVVLSTLVLFFYAVFFFESPPVERKIAENQITTNKELSDLQTKETSTQKIPESGIEKVELESNEKVELESSTEQSEEVIKLPYDEKLIKDSLFATVGSKAITQSDIVNEIKIILILTGQSFNEDIREQLQSGAIQSIIKRIIKTIEIEKHTSLEFNRPDIDRELKRFADNLYMDLDTFENTFFANGIPFSHIINQIEVELLWNSLIFQLYKDRLIINLDEIDEQLKSYQSKEEVEEYLISEIIIKPVPKAKLESTIKEIKNKIKNEGFEKVAINLSLSETRLQGGNLGWVSENAISEKFKSKIINTPVGNISEPILLPEGILLYKVRDKRKLKSFETIEEAKSQLVNAEKSKILRMHALSHFENLRKSISINYFLND